MNILLVSNSDLEGGAARATYRLHQGLQSLEMNAHLLVQSKQSSNSRVIGTHTSSGIGQAARGLRLTLDQLPLKQYPHRQSQTYSVQWVPSNVVSKVEKLAPDIINLHWINNGYISIEALAKFPQPLVWTLHDMWAFTGGCHYNQQCTRYIESCGQCPQLGSQHPRDLSHQTWHRKAQAWKNLNLTIVTPSQWLAECARSSALFQHRRVECIPNGIDTNIYRPLNRRAAREILQLPQDKLLLLSGSLSATSDKRKGFHLLQPALQELSQSGWHDRLELIVFGSSRPDNPPDLGLKTHYLGNFGDDCSLALVYSAADIFIAPSLQDNLPNTVLEAMACGTPCIAFDIGGMPDLIEHQQTGYLAKALDNRDLIHGIIWLLEDWDRYQDLSKRVRDQVEVQFSLKVQARQYISLFAEIQEDNHGKRHCSTKFRD